MRCGGFVFKLVRPVSARFLCGKMRETEGAGTGKKEIEKSLAAILLPYLERLRKLGMTRTKRVRSARNKMLKN